MDRRTFLCAAGGLVAGCTANKDISLPEYDDVSFLCPRTPYLLLAPGEEPPVLRWASTDLSYCIVNRDRGDMRPGVWDAEIEAAFGSWEDCSPLTFDRIGDPEVADILMAAGKGPDHWFDGPHGILAWAYLPSNDHFEGRLVSMVDKDERWLVRPDKGKKEGVYLRAVLAHEIGHLLGLAHSNFPGALMYPYYRPGIDKPQTFDDVFRIRALYPEDRAGYRQSPGEHEESQ